LRVAALVLSTLILRPVVALASGGGFGNVAVSDVPLERCVRHDVTMCQLCHKLVVVL